VHIFPATDCTVHDSSARTCMVCCPRAIPATVGRQNFINQKDVSGLVLAKLKLGVYEDQAPLSRLLLHTQKKGETGSRVEPKRPGQRYFPPPKNILKMAVEPGGKQASVS
jgi:hypothetical protein